MTNCKNCGACIEADKNKCPYCGTSYFDISSIPLKEPFMLRLNVGTKENPQIITEMVRMREAKNNDIIKALECCINNKCSNCPLRKMACSETVAMENALGLINRQKAEIKRLKGWQDLLKAEKHSLIKAEAIKEFAEALNEKLYSFPTVYNSAFRKMVDNLVKEMTEKGR